MKRVFLALPLQVTDSFTSYYRGIRNNLPRTAVKWVNPENMHLTLRFFGNIEETDILKIIAGISRATGNTESFNTRFISLGVFRSVEKPQVLWVGCNNPANLIRLKKDIDNELSVEGFQPEKGKYSPHLTIGRVKPGNQIPNMREIIGKYKKTIFMDQAFSEVILFESILHPEGPEYIPLERFVLKLSDTFSPDDGK